MIGIYKIENLINHKIYVGQSIHIERRWREHCRPSTRSLISSAIKKYGKENFSFQILEECSRDELNEKEDFYIQKFNCVVPNGYNIKEQGDGKETIFYCYDKETFLSIVEDIKADKISFQEIGEKYDISVRSVYYINNGEFHRLQDEVYPLRQLLGSSKKYYYCSICGAKITREAKLCKRCASQKQQIVERPTREELKSLIRTTPFITIGKQYGVSDNAIRKWCKAYNLPSKSTEIKKMDDTQWALV